MVVFFVSVYLILMLAIGFFASKKVTSLEEFLVAGRQLPVWIAVPTIVATWFGAGTCLGVSGKAYSVGFSGIIADPLGSVLALIVASLFFIAPFRRRNLITISDLIKETYGPRLEKITSFLMLPFYIGTLASQMVALGYILSLFTGIDPIYGMLIGAFTVFMYTSVGGMWAVTFTDLIQFFLVICGLFLFIPLFMKQDAALFTSIKKELPQLLPQEVHLFGMISYLGKWLMTGLGAIMGQDLLQRTMSCKSEKIAVKSTLIASVIYFLLGLIPLCIGLYGREVMPNLSESEMLIPYLAKQSFSPFLFTIFLVGLLSAIMSTADSYMLAGTSIVAHNIIGNRMYRSSKPLIWIRGTNFCITLISLGVGILLPRIFDLMVHSGAILFVGVFIPVTAALYVKKPNAFCALLSIIFGFSFWIFSILYFSITHYGPYTDALFASAFIGAVASFFAYAIPYLYFERQRLFTSYEATDSNVQV